MHQAALPLYGCTRLLQCLCARALLSLLFGGIVLCVYASKTAPVIYMYIYMYVCVYVRTHLRMLGGDVQPKYLVRTCM